MAEEKTFKHYEELPSDVRMEIINEMQPIERVIFTRCSKTSQNEAKKSKNYIYELRLFLPRHRQETIAISVFHRKYKEYERNDWEGYEMKFKKEGGKQKYSISQLRYSYRELYKVELDESVDLVEHAKEHFKKLLQQYQNTIKSLYISETDNYDYGIKSLKNLESLSLYKNSDVVPFFSLIRRPLKRLHFEDTANHEIITAGDQIYQVQGRLEAHRLKVNYEQFKRLNAREIKISIWGLTLHDLYDFIKSWKTGTIRETFRYCWWDLGVLDFNKDELIRLLGLDKNYEKVAKFEIKHDTVARRNAELVC